MSRETYDKIDAEIDLKHLDLNSHERRALIGRNFGFLAELAGRPIMLRYAVGEYVNYEIAKKEKGLTPSRDKVYDWISGKIREEDKGICLEVQAYLTNNPGS